MRAGTSPEGYRPTLGAVPLGAGRTSFRFWAPRAECVRVRLLAGEQQPERTIELRPEARGYWRAIAEDAPPGTLYFVRLGEGEEYPDPASRWQPQGVHGPSAVVPREFPWSDAGWRGPRLEEYVFYELHVGTFTPEGTFEAVITQLDRMRELGITCVEIMPVAQFAGERNWGYDGVLPFAVQHSYGGPAGLRRLVDVCHARGLAVCLDVVYNHLGPEGNVAPAFGPYLNERYATPWGGAMNFDAGGSDEVRRFFIENALGWIVDFHVDALRLDAVHAMLDTSAVPFLQELADAVHRVADRLGRHVYLVAESDLNDPRLVQPPELGGFGLDAQWMDDFHHSLHVLLTGEATGYYQDFNGVSDLARAFRNGYVYTGQYSAYRGRRHGASARAVPARRFVVYAQNHDQVGNRAQADRLSTLVDFESLKLAAAAVCLSPFLPLLFMGEEYGEEAPFMYFVSHTDPELVEAVRRGRREEFAAFYWRDEPPDPHGRETFESARLRHGLRREEDHRTIAAFYRELLRLRRELPALANLSREELEAVPLEECKALYVRRWCDMDDVALLLHFGEEQG
ncbi:MAG TPA: malto-oligosyltrehalose trehalohydrolase, partial [Longimicrobiales bacterium]